MSVLTRNRILSFTAAISLIATASFASAPTARTQARLIYDRASTNLILFGGESPNDNGTKQAYALDETWSWNGVRWMRLYPAHSPGGRSAFSFVYDTARNRAVLFGGAAVKEELGDTWIYQNGDWTKLDPPASPEPRVFAGTAYDNVRDRIVLFGGTHTVVEGRASVVKTYVDTWEFDGITWVKRAATGPAVNKPLLVWDDARKETLLLGLNDDQATVMYRYKPADATWEVITPATKPACVNEAGIAYNPLNQTVFLSGGVCPTSDAILEDNYEWDGTNWKKLEVTTHAGAQFGQAMAFDELRGLIVMVDGTEAFAAPHNRTWLFRNNGWVAFVDPFSPGPRSLFALRGDTKNNAMWLFGGFNDTEVFGDFWKFQNGTWSKIDATGGPTASCGPNAAYDQDRGKLVVICIDSSTFEWDGAAWKKFEIESKNLPVSRNFSSMVYDQNLKKTVLFGGYSNPEYLDQTWTWDGTAWTRVKKNAAPARALTTMWFDPVLNRTVLYGGIGRQDTRDRIVRYSDMWSFDGSGWTELKNVTTPGIRYGAQVAVDPATKKTILFGGLRVDQNGAVLTQVYGNDTWEWDGKAWTKLTTATAPPARENGFFDYDPSRGALTLFGGFSGFYHSDVWSFKDGKWSIITEPPITRRRAAAR
jgi:hypothetical protein